jgi:hypothetical protein
LLIQWNPVLKFSRSFQAILDLTGRIPPEPGFV